MVPDLRKKIGGEYSMDLVGEDSGDGSGECKIVPLSCLELMAVNGGYYNPTTCVISESMMIAGVVFLGLSLVSGALPCFVPLGVSGGAGSKMRIWAGVAALTLGLGSGGVVLAVAGFYIAMDTCWP